MVIAAAGVRKGEVVGVVKEAMEVVTEATKPEVMPETVRDKVDDLMEKFEGTSEKMNAPSEGMKRTAVSSVISVAMGTEELGSGGS